jgi:hypothetical protein
MYFYRYTRPGHADDGMRVASPDDLAALIGANAVKPPPVVVGTRLVPTGEVDAETGDPAMAEEDVTEQPAWNQDYRYYVDITAEVAAAEAVTALPRAQAAAIRRVNQECGAFRASLATDIPFQAGVYADKREEAARYVSGVPNPVDFPYLAAEAAATGVKLKAMIATINAISAQWTAVSVAVEARRRGAIVAIEAASTVEQVKAAVPQVWP